MDKLISAPEKVKRINMILFIVIIIEIIICLMPYFSIRLGVGNTVLGAESACYVAPNFVVDTVKTMAFGNNASSSKIGSKIELFDTQLSLLNEQDSLTAKEAINTVETIHILLNFAFASILAVNLFIVIFRNDELSNRIMIFPLAIFIISVVQIIMLSVAGFGLNINTKIVSFNVLPTAGLIVNVMMSLLLSIFSIVLNLKLKENSK